MCGRYVTPDTQAIENWWHGGLSVSETFPFHFNAAPTVPVPIIRNGSESQHSLELARWGLIPHWWNQPNLPSFSFNARSEEAHSKPMWREAYQHSRCIMPAAGWYEWQTKETIDPQTGEVKTVKQPYFLSGGSQPVIGIAGLFSVWNSPERGPVLTCALLTKSASDELMAVHDRMPVILNREACDEWLRPDLSKNDVGQLIATSEGHFEFFPVSRAVNNARNNNAELIHPITL